MESYLMLGGMADKLNDMSLEEIEASAVVKHEHIGVILEEVLWK
jgi:hypothetical protein